MNYTINYGNYEFEVEQKYNDILAYEFNKAFNVEYSPYGVLYTQEQKDFVKSFESKWLHNEIHEYDYYTTHNYDFLDWLKAYYESEAEDAQCAVEGEYYGEYDDPDEWWDSLDYTTKTDVMETYNDW